MRLFSYKIICNGIVKYLGNSYVHIKQVLFTRKVLWKRYKKMRYKPSYIFTFVKITSRSIEDKCKYLINIGRAAVVVDQRFIIWFNRLSRRKRGMASNPLFIIPDFFLNFPNELCVGYLRFEGNGKIPLGSRRKSSALLAVSV